MFPLASITLFAHLWIVWSNYNNSMGSIGPVNPRSSHIIIKFNGSNRWWNFWSWDYFPQQGQGESAGPYWGHHVNERRHWWPKEGSSYSPWVVEADYSLSPTKTACMWLRATSYERWPCCAEHSAPKGLNHEKQSPIPQCECRAYGMKGSGWVCH